MFKFVEAKAKTCKQCKTFKKSKTRQQPFVPIELQAFEWGECWSVDIMSIGKLDHLVCVHGCIFFLLLTGEGIGKIRIFRSFSGKIRISRGKNCGFRGK